MRPVLLALGPWNYSALPVIFVALFAVMLGWQWAEWRYSQGARLSAVRIAITALPAALLSLLFFWGVNKVAPLEIKAWGTMLVLAFSAGGFLISRRADPKVIKPAEAVDLALYCLIGAVLGARVIFVALDWGSYAGHPAKLLNVWEGGLSFHGGLIGAFLAGILFARQRGKVFWAVADETTPSIALGYSFARIGCFLNGCCHGNVCHLPWAVRFPYSDMPNALVHPTQLYALVTTATIFVILSELRGKMRRPGHLFMIYLMLYSVERFFIEFARAGATGKYVVGGFWLTQGQLASLGIILVAAIAMALTWKRPPVSSVAQETPAVPTPKRSGGKKH